MGRPKRAASASTTIITFRLTAAEAQRLNELAIEQGHKDRSSLLRAWIAQSGPMPQTADDAATLSAPAKTPTLPANLQQPTAKTASLPKQGAPSEQFDALDFVKSLRVAIHRAKDLRSGLSRIPDVVRALLPRFAIEHIYAIMGLLGGTGYLEFYPKDREPLSREDDALCPCDAEGIALLHVRWMGKE